MLANTARTLMVIPALTAVSRPAGPRPTSRSRLRARAPRIRGSVAALLLGLTGVVVAAISAWLLLGSGRAQFQPEVSGFAAPLVDLIAAAFVMRAASRAPRGRIRAAWALIGIGMVVYAMGDALWAWIAVIRLEDPFPSAADGAYVVFYPLVGAALLLFPSPALAKREAIRLIIDSAIVVLGGGMVVWHSLLGPLLGDPEMDLALQSLALGYPVGDLVLLFAVATIALRRPAGIDPRALVALVGGLALMFVADIAYGELELAGASGESWVDVTYMASSLAIALAGFSQAKIRPLAEDEATPRVGRALLLLPYVALAAGFAVLIAAAQSSGGGRVMELVQGAAGLTVLVLIRQEVINRDNARLLADSARLEAEARYRSLEGQASDTFLLVDAHGVVAYASWSLERVLDIDRSELVGRRITQLAHADDIEALTRFVGDTASGRPVAPLEWRVWTREGVWRLVETIPSNLLGDPAIGKIVLTTRDVGERTALRQQVAQAALRDALTGIPNRVLFEDRIAQAIAAEPRLGIPTSVLLLDLDGFSRLNGSFGHAVGDRVLREVARRLTATTRAVDTVARVGGDGFGILVGGTGTAAEAAGVAERVRVALLEPITEGSTTFELTACVGIATTDGVADADAGKLLRDADVAMTVARGRGHDQVVVFEPSMQHDLEGRFELEADLRHAIAAGELVVHYQPIVELATREIVAAEALVRWDHPTRGRLGPNAFIPLAEETGLIGEIGAWVLQEACHEVARWARLAPGRVPRVSVNLAAAQLADPQLPWHVQTTLAAAGAAPGWLTLEVTESVLVTDTLAAMECLQAIRALGIKISVDDFGTGYSSLSYLQQFPINHIKIDRSFVAPLDDPDKGPGLVPAIVEIGRALGMTTIAEGIETERELERLQEIGCTFGQGYLFGRPADAETMRALIRGPMVKAA